MHVKRTRVTYPLDQIAGYTFFLFYELLFFQLDHIYMSIHSVGQVSSIFEESADGYSIRVF